jgi:hypothetical protein
MNGIQKPRNGKFKVKRPIKIQYASTEEVSRATAEIIQEHPYTLKLLSKT